MLMCGCQHVTDAEIHQAWHALVVEQGGPSEVVNAASLRAARGFTTGTLDGETILDTRARESGKRASGAMRRASHD